MHISIKCEILDYTDIKDLLKKLRKLGAWRRKIGFMYLSVPCVKVHSLVFLASLQKLIKKKIVIITLGPQVMDVQVKAMSLLLCRCSPSVVLLLCRQNNAGLVRAGCFGICMFKLLDKPLELN